MYTLKYNSQILDCVISEQRKYTLDYDLEKISQEYKIATVHLKRLCENIHDKTQYSYFEAMCIISEELESGMDINKIILKYNLDKDLI
jgi:hypothetical protein